MLKRKKNSSAGSDNAQGISEGGNLLSRVWLLTTAIAVVPVVLAFVYLLLMREGAIRSTLVTEISQMLASQQADRVNQLLQGFEQRMTAAASSPLALSAVASDSAADIALVEKAMLDYFPGASSLRLIRVDKLGNSGFEESDLGLRNLIEVDLLNRTIKSEPENPPGPESYKFEERWLTSLARKVVHPRMGERESVIFASFDNDVFAAALQSQSAAAGRSSLQQLYNKGNFNRADEIAAAGDAQGRKYEAQAELNNGLWLVTFTPGENMVARLSPNSLGLIIAMGGAALAVLVAAVLTLVMFGRGLKREAQQISAAAETRAELKVALPALLPVARQLRLATQRSAKRAATARKAEPTATTDPLYQSGEMIVEEADDELFAAHAAGTANQLPAHIFRAYDIRGRADTELADDIVTLIGKAIGTMAEEQGQQTLIVACDGRLTSPRIKTTLVKALIDSGRDVMEIGAVPTPLLYFATHTLDCRSGVMITGSHNPADYNGFKIVLDGMPVAADQIQELLHIASTGAFSEGAGRLAKRDVKEQYLETVISDMAIAMPLKIVVDAGNGIAGELAPTLLEELGCEAIPLYCEVDGNFPNHHPDPSDETNLQDLCAQVVAEGADFGVALDGDGDRLCVVNRNGDVIRNDRLLAVFAEDVVARNPGADVIYDVKCSGQLTQMISRMGGRPILWKTGHSFMKEKMQETGAMLGGEFSGHMFFAERWYGFDDGLYAMARLAEIVSATEDGLDGLLAEFPETYSTAEIRIPVDDDAKFKLITELAGSARFDDGKVNTLDGLRVDFADGWGLVRASNTVPALTARFEGDSPESLERIKNQFREQLANVDPVLDPGF